MEPISYRNDSPEVAAGRLRAFLRLPPSTFSFEPDIRQTL